MKSAELFRYGEEDIKPTDFLAISTRAAVRSRGVEWRSRGGVTAAERLPVAPPCLLSPLGAPREH